jgi:hypothetical protein
VRWGCCSFDVVGGAERGVKLGIYLRTQVMRRGRPVEIDRVDVTERRLQVVVKL